MVNSSANSSNLSAFIRSQQRDAERLAMAAWGVGATHPWFRALPRSEQVAKVQEWVSQAVDNAAERRATAWQRNGYCGA